MTEILVQVVADPGRAGQLAGGGSLTERFADRIDELGASLGEIANGLRERLDADLREEPEGEGLRLREVALAFSLDLEAGANMVVAKAKTGAAFEARLTWTRGE